MNQNDTLDFHAFYHWDSIPYETQVASPNSGVLVNDTINLFFLHDSIEIQESVVRQSLFTSHGFAARNERLQERTDASAPLWIFVLLLVTVALTTLYYRTNKIKFKGLLSSLFDMRAMERMLRESNLNGRFSFVPMGLLVVTCLMLPVHQMALAKTGISEYLLLVAAVTALYLLRNGLLRLLATIFDNGAAVDGYITSNYLYHLTLATIFLPLLFPLTYMPFGKGVLLYLLLGLVVLELVLRLIRGLKLFLTQSSGPYVYLFYYLCIVEIVPILVLVKWVIE